MATGADHIADIKAASAADTRLKALSYLGLTAEASNDQGPALLRAMPLPWAAKILTEMKNGWRRFRMPLIVGTIVGNPHRDVRDCIYGMLRDEIGVLRVCFNSCAGQTYGYLLKDGVTVVLRNARVGLFPDAEVTVLKRNLVFVFTKESIDPFLVDKPVMSAVDPFPLYVTLKASSITCVQFRSWEPVEVLLRDATEKKEWLVTKMLDPKKAGGAAPVNPEQQLVQPTVASKPVANVGEKKKTTAEGKQGEEEEDGIWTNNSMFEDLMDPAMDVEVKKSEEGENGGNEENKDDDEMSWGDTDSSVFEDLLKDLKDY